VSTKLKAEPVEKPDWKSDAKARLRGLVERVGSQRKLAKLWLGSAARAGQVSNYCSDSHTAFPEVDKLIALRQLCADNNFDFSLDWLLGGARPMPGAWTHDRRERLVDELTDFMFTTMFEREDYLTGRGTRGDMSVKSNSRENDSPSPRPGAYWGVRYKSPELHAWVTNQIGGDSLAFFANQINTLVDGTIENLTRLSEYEDARRWRNHKRRLARKT